MRLLHKETPEYATKLAGFVAFCDSYTRHKVFYVSRSKEILEMLATKMPGRKGIVADPSTCSFIVQEYSGRKVSISDEVFGLFCLHSDEKFSALTAELGNLYKPGLIEVLAFGDTYHAKAMERIVQPLLQRIHKYYSTFKYMEERKANESINHRSNRN